MNPVIRKAGKQDQAAWAQMRSTLWPDDSPEGHLKDLDFWLRQSGFQGWMVLDGDQPVGFAEAFIRPFANGCDSRPVAFLEGIWVRESHRRRGIARRLLSAVEDWAREQGIRELGSDTEVENKLSQLRHAQWGFEETERVVYYRKKLT